MSYFKTKGSKKGVQNKKRVKKLKKHCKNWGLIQKSIIFDKKLKIWQNYDSVH